MGGWPELLRLYILLARTQKVLSERPGVGTRESVLEDGRLQRRQDKCLAVARVAETHSGNSILLALGFRPGDGQTMKDKVREHWAFLNKCEAMN